MTWHLKNRELERKLVELYPSFLDDLKFGVMHKWNRHCVHVECTRVRGNGAIPNDTVSFWDDELEEVHEYNPKAWNKFPQIIPPENVRMRVEFNFEDEPEKTYHACFHFFSGKWYLDSCKSSIASSIVNIRYRPWED